MRTQFVRQSHVHRLLSQPARILAVSTHTFPWLFLSLIYLAILFIYSICGLDVSVNSNGSAKSINLHWHQFIVFGCTHSHSQFVHGKFKVSGSEPAVHNTFPLSTKITFNKNIYLFFFQNSLTLIASILRFTNNGFFHGNNTEFKRQIFFV